MFRIIFLLLNVIIIIFLLLWLYGEEEKMKMRLQIGNHQVMVITGKSNLLFLGNAMSKITK